MTHKFFKRLSSIKVDYEKEHRRTVQRFQSSYRDSSATFLRDRDEIIRLLRNTLKYDDLEQLYIELFAVLFPTVGERDRPDSKPLLAFLHKIFPFENQTHVKIMERAKSYQTGDRVLFLEVVEARNLPGMDLNGLSDPFCTLYVTTKESSKRTRVIEKSLNPQWKETFKFKLNEPHKDFLRIEVWDHDPQERLRDKLKKYKDITSARGIGSFVRDLGHGRNSAQEFIGRVSIPLKDVTSETTERWWPLGTSAENGEIYLRLALGMDKDRADAVNWYRGVLQLLIIYELGKPHVMAPFQWEHISEVWGEYLLRQMHTGWGLTPKDILLAKWIAYTRIHAVFPLSGRMFPPLVFEVFESAINSEFNANDASQVVEASKELISFSVEFVEKVHEFYPCIVTTSQLYYILKTLEVLGKSLDRFRISCDNRTPTRTEITSTIILAQIKNAVRQAAKIKMLSIVSSLPKKPPRTSIPNPEWELHEAKQLLQIGQLIIDDLEKGLSVVDKDFKIIMKLDFHQNTYEVFDVELEKLMKPFITTFCNCLKTMCERPTLKTDNTTHPEAATFLHLYLCLRKFAELSPTSDTAFQYRIKPSFHVWFAPGVSYLFDLMSQVWMGWMEKAVQADYELSGSGGGGPSNEEINLMSYSYPNEADAKVTSSAVDSVQIFTQIQSFWKTLNWPDPRQSVIFAKKLLRELCGFSILFANLTYDGLIKQEGVEGPPTRKVSSGNGGVDADPYHITPRLCQSVNNITFVGDYTKEIAVHFNLQQLLLDIQTDSSSEEGGSLMAKQMEIQESGLNGIIDSILISAVKKMENWSRNTVLAILRANDEKNPEKFDTKIIEFLNYLTANLKILDENILSAMFVPFLAIIWENFLQILKFIVATGIKDGKSYEHFIGVKNTLEIVKGYFETAILRHSGRNQGGGLGGVAGTLNISSNYANIMKELEVYATPVAGIKSLYLDRRYDNQQKPNSSTGEGTGRGLICVQAIYQRNEEILLLEILNASKLLPADSNGKSDPFVQIGFAPEENFTGWANNLSTKVVKEELYPIFEETFKIKLPKQMMMSSGGTGGNYLRLIVYDHDFLQRNEFLGEAFLPLDKIETTSSSGSPSNLRNILLPLTAPSEADVEYLKSLMKNRVDKELKRFWDCEKEKLIKPTI